MRGCVVFISFCHASTRLRLFAPLCNLHIVYALSHFYLNIFLEKVTYMTQYLQTHDKIVIRNNAKD